MKTDRELLEQALEWLDNLHLNIVNEAGLPPIDAAALRKFRAEIRARIAEDDEEPVGYITYIEDAGILFTQDEPEHGVYEPVYASPQTKKNS